MAFRAGVRRRVALDDEVLQAGTAYPSNLAFGQFLLIVVAVQDGCLGLFLLAPAPGLLGHSGLLFPGLRLRRLSRCFPLSVDGPEPPAIAGRTYYRRARGG